MRKSFPLASLTPEQIGQAVKAFRAEKCPACGGEKTLLADPLCGPCLDRLPADLKEKITTKQHFIGAFHPVIEYLTGGAAKGETTDPEYAGGAKSG